MAHALASPLVQLDSLRVLPVADVPDGTDCAALGDAMVRAGLPLLEVTLRRPGAIDTLAALAADDRLLVGAGTVVNAGQARDAIRSLGVGGHLVVGEVSAMSILDSHRGELRHGRGSRVGGAPS